MKNFFLLCILTVIFGSFSGLNAQSLQLLKQEKLSKWGIPAGNYSGITYLGNDRYAVISDKQEADGYYVFEIKLDEKTAKVKDVNIVAFHKNDNKARDAEDICYVKSTGKIYIAAEDDQRIIEYDTLGNRTGKELFVPEAFSKDNIYPNYGFESLAYSDSTKLFWTCTEHSLKSDYKYATYSYKHEAHLRLQAFDVNMKPLKAAKETYYITEEPTVKHEPKLFAFGVPAITALEDGSLLVLEREFYVANNYIGSYVVNRLNIVSRKALDNLNSKTNEGCVVYGLVKMPIGAWKTKFNLTKRNIANYEGMCLGPKLKDGRQTILLISDSQGGYGNSLFHLKDYLRVGILSQ